MLDGVAHLAPAEAPEPVTALLRGITDRDRAAHINADPYATWICRIRSSDVAELDELMSATTYRSRIDG